MISHCVLCVEYCCFVHSKHVALVTQLVIVHELNNDWDMSDTPNALESVKSRKGAAWLLWI
jgi:hypothetical protein